MRKLITLIISVLGTVISGGGNLEGKVEEALKNELGERVKDVRVEVHSNPGSLLINGKIASMDFTFDEFYVEPVLMDEVVFSVKDVRVNLLKSAISGEAKIKKVGDITYRFIVRQNDLAEGLHAKVSNILDPQVTIKGGQIEISGKYQLGIIKVPFTVSGYVSYENKKTLNYRITEVRFVGVKVPAAIDRILEREINPLFDLEEFFKEKGGEWKMNEEMLGRKLNLTVRHILASEGKITVTGSI